MESVDTFYKGALQRTGTLYEGAREGVVKSSETFGEVAMGGLKRTGTIIEDARQNAGTYIEGARQNAGTYIEGARQNVLKRMIPLKRTGTVSLEGAREGILKRSGTISQGAYNGLQKTGSILGGATAGIAERTGSWNEWMVWGQGFYNPKLALTASFRELTGIDLPRAYHTVSVINGRAYIFGGEYAPGQLANNEMHVLILPSSSVLEADYKSIAPRPLVKDGPVPDARKNHTAVIIENEIYIFGGELSPKAKGEEAGRIWVFDTMSNKWSFHDPEPNSPYPPPRFLHAAASTNRPEPPNTDDSIDLVKQEEDPSETVPSIPANDSWGTIFIYGGKAVKEEGEEILNDAWAFDVQSRSWLPLPPPPGPARFSASLTLANNHLYRVGGQNAVDQPGATVDYLDVGELFVALSLGKSFNKIALPTLLSEWTTTKLSTTSNAASVTEVTANGRNFLVSISPGAKTVTGIHLTPASSVRMAGADSHDDQEAAPQEVVVVKVQYADAYGDVIEVESDDFGKHTFAQQEAFASGAGSEVDAASIVVWGGKDASGKLLSNGWMVVVE
jgi:hypothetical protein